MKKFGSGIRNKRPRSATLLSIEYFRCKICTGNKALRVPLNFRSLSFVVVKTAVCTSTVCREAATTSVSRLEWRHGRAAALWASRKLQVRVTNRMWKVDSNVPVSYCINSVPDPYIFGPPGSGSKTTCMEPWFLQFFVIRYLLSMCYIWWLISLYLISKKLIFLAPWRSLKKRAGFGAGSGFVILWYGSAPLAGGGGTLSSGRGVGGGVPIPTRDIHCGTLDIYVLCRYQYGATA